MRRGGWDGPVPAGRSEHAACTREAPAPVAEEVGRCWMIHPALKIIITNNNNNKKHCSGGRASNQHFYLGFHCIGLLTSENCGPPASGCWHPRCGLLGSSVRGLGSARSSPAQRSSLLGEGKNIHHPSIQWCHRNVSPGKGYWKKQRSSLFLQQLVGNLVQCALSKVAGRVANL